MTNKALRVALYVLFVGIVAAAAFMVWKRESESAAALAAARGFDEKSRALVRVLLEIKAAQPGYVAVGQGEPYWLDRVTTLLENGRKDLSVLKAHSLVAPAQADVAAAEDALEDFAQMDRRAREYVAGGQRLLASDLVFTDGIQKTDTAIAAVERAAREELASAEGVARQARSAALLALAGAGVGGVLIMTVLTPVPRRRPETAAVAQPDEQRTPLTPSATRQREKRATAPPRQLAPVPASRTAPTASRSENAQPTARVAASDPIDMLAIAALCTDLARVVDTQALAPALERAAKLLSASGLVIWVADPDGRELLPVMTHGYPSSMAARLGTISRDAENATAAAFRTGLIQTVKADATAPGAIAAPLVTATGPVGVMAAEVPRDAERQDATRAAAAIVAAQLATLVGPPSVRAQTKSEAV